MVQTAEQPDAAERRSNRRVLMFAKTFPPCNCWPTASQRASGLAHGLTKMGWSPIVITRQPATGGCRCGAVPDERGAFQPITDVTVIRVPVRQVAFGRLRRILTGASDDWIRQARRATKHQLTNGAVDVVWTTTAPTSSARLGHALQRRLKVPWVAELRDSLFRRTVLTVRGRSAKASFLRTRASILARTFREADAVVHVSLQESMADAEMIRQPSHVLPSAFDEEAWSRIHASPLRGRNNEKTLSVLFAGRAYPGRAGYSVFFEGVLRYAQSSRGESRPIQVLYMGPTSDLFRAEAERVGVSAELVDLGVVPLERSREAMRDADALLLVTAPESEQGSPGGKLFEYLAACRPILAITGADEFVADILQYTGHGRCLPDAAAVESALGQLASGSFTVPAWPSDSLREFTWTERSRQLADLFQTCLAEHRTAEEPSHASKGERV